MAVALAPILRILLIAAITKSKCDPTSGYSVSGGRSASQIGDLLKPPPPPLSQILPAPFHGGKGRSQRHQNKNFGYNYQPPPSPLPAPIPMPSDFKFPAPFYKQYNLNFVPQPQPFSTTPSPSLFQKVSGWLFPSAQTSYDSSLVSGNNLSPVKKNCNPCNLVPWMPLIKYNNLGAKNVQQHLPTYGPPSPTANNLPNIVQYKPQHFQSQAVATPSPILSPGVPHTSYGPPVQAQGYRSVSTLSSTYGPPSPTHTVDMPSQSSLSSNLLVPSTSYELPSSSYSAPSPLFGQPTSSYLPTLTQWVPSNSFNFASSAYLPPTSSYATPSPSYGSPFPSTTYGTVTIQYEPGTFNTDDRPKQDDVEVFNQIEKLREQQLPKISPQTGFKNSYGESITNTHIFDIPYSHPASATGAASTKINTEVLPDDTSKFRSSNVSLALANPAPFTLNKGRNIHTLQPVALPNLSVSPLPPIFNARPFRPISTSIVKNILQGDTGKQSISNIQIQQSVPLVEYTHSVDYPATFIQSPVIDIDAPKVVNQTKAYRNIPNSYVIDEIRDISSQASEDHISATKSDSDSSFESTGTDIGNYLYDGSIPADIKPKIPLNHKTSFADLRDIKDEDVDKYRTESNLQEIDSPLLYLKPSAPHKSHGDFILAVSAPVTEHEFEIYDDIITTTISPLTTLTSGWEESRKDVSQNLPPPIIQENVYQPKIVQIIVPYTSSEQVSDNTQTVQIASQDWPNRQKEEYKPRKVPLVTEESRISSSTDSFSTTTETLTPFTTENYDLEGLTPPTGLDDLYDVKEPPFDVIKLQHTIDDWTAQEYSKQFKTPQRTRSSEKYAKQIPDEFFTTTVPTNDVTDNDSYNYDFYDHEVSSSIQHSVRDESINSTNKQQKVYNSIDRNNIKENNDDIKDTDIDIDQKLHVYTAASSFRISTSTTTSTTTTSTSTTTPPPWDKIQVSISPLTKEKVYVVTSKPWREARNVTNDWYTAAPLDSNKLHGDSITSPSDNLPFKSPRFLNRPSFGFTSGGKIESAKTDSAYIYSKSWYQSINELEKQPPSNITILPENSHYNTTTNLDEDTTGTTTAGAHEYSDV